jgi:hypothetical protein
MHVGIAFYRGVVESDARRDSRRAVPRGCVTQVMRSALSWMCFVHEL